jgi:hypothetical protein
MRVARRGGGSGFAFLEFAFLRIYFERILCLTCKMTCMPLRLTIAYFYSFFGLIMLCFIILLIEILLLYYLVSSPETVSSAIEILLQEWQVQMLLIPP